MAEHLGRPTVLIDVSGGAARRRRRDRGRGAASSAATCVVCVDVGGDVLAHGDEPGLAARCATR